MNFKHLYWIIPLVYIAGFSFGLYIGIPKHVTIDTGDNLKEFSSMMQNISLNYAAACHNLTYECICDTNNKKIQAQAPVCPACPTCETKSTYSDECENRVSLYRMALAECLVNVSDMQTMIDGNCYQQLTNCNDTLGNYENRLNNISWYASANR